LDDVLSGNVAARALAGQLLLIQATDTNELPERLGSVGEAYYHWRPRASSAEDPFERSLADFLTRRAESAGLPNSIQLVRPGDRFDNSRHTANSRGIEIVAVHGWIVLRDNQKVYTKASVSLR
jgi:LDH2 family malate/lactate/ureidoglycolate dehydrogenase